MDTTYPASYQGYQEWQSAQQTVYDNLMSNTTLASEHPMAYIMALMGFLMMHTQQQVGWNALEIQGASQILNVLSNLQGAFSESSGSYNSDIDQPIDEADALYNQLEAVPEGSPFYDVAQTVTQQLKAIFPPGWTFPTSGADYNSVYSWWQTQWHAAVDGNTSYITETNTAFSNAISAVNGVSSEFQSENKYYNSSLQEYQGFFHDTTQCVASVESQSVTNQTPN
ncbi:MAG: hypothetical protein KDK64_01930 [Chlamydiia bacterium]|nr:hypothetical protein [Chlamydiia bacterium]